jgi:ketosteroid isomerase-like protein
MLGPGAGGPPQGEIAMRAQAEPVVHVEDGRFKVTEWRFAPGAETGWHVHGHDYVVVPLDDGLLRLEEPGGGGRDAPLTRHAPYARRAGVAHNVINGGPGPLAFLELEVVDDALARAREAVLARFLDAWNARDVDGLMDCMAEDCAFHAAAGPDVEGARHVGRAAVRAAYAAIFETWPQAEWREGRHAVLGETGVSSWRFVGTARDGRAADVRGCDLFAFDGELIALKDSYRKARS